MAALKGYLAGGTTDSVASGTTINPRAGAIASLGDDLVRYAMVGVDTTGAVVRWTASFPDWGAVAYAGPNKPIAEVAVSMARPI